MAIYYEDYIPRPRLTALNACASFLEGTACKQSYRPTDNAYVFLFEGKEPIGVAWNMNVPARLSVPMRADGLKAFDMMGNPLPVSAEGTGAAVEIPAERPVFLRATGDAESLKKAIAAAQAKDVDTVVVAANPTAGGIEAKVTSRSSGPQDGVVEVVPASGSAPAAQHFQSLGPGESKTFTFALPSKGAAGEVRVRVGNRRMQEVKAPLAGK